MDLSRKISASGLRTVCKEAKCPNSSVCFSCRQVTFLILGAACTRSCRFCNVSLSKEKLSLEPDEPDRICALVEQLGLEYVVVTSVTRDDLPDKGAGQFVKVINLLHAFRPRVLIEVLIPDFGASWENLKKVVAARPFIIAHNIETVRSLYPYLRPESDYDTSLALLRKVKELDSRIIVKSSLILGMGERQEEVVLTMQDIRSTGCDILTIGQYLSPSKEHLAVKEFISPGQFERYRQVAESLGFKKVVSAPLARSSYLAGMQAREFQYA